MSYCGLDFGTSNSTISTFHNGNAALIPVEGSNLTIPSSIFYHFDSNEVLFGREAINEYIDGEFGRLMRSLKSVLGTPLMHDTTQIKTKNMLFTEIIETFISEIKNRAELNSGKEFSQVIMGRPVNFVDDDKAADASAQAALEKIAKNAGFKEVNFQYEPIAAALDYEQTVTKEEIALIVDLGGGTSDFSIVKISPELINKSDRKSDILASGGIHIGGTNFDKDLSLNSVMPHLGYGAHYKEDPAIEMPSVYHHNLATWHKIHLMYGPKTIIDLKALLYRIEEKNLIERLIHTIENKEGHRLAIEVENSKVALTTQNETVANLDFIEKGLNINITNKNLNAAISNDVACIEETIKSTIATADLTTSNITKIFMTGGSTAIPLIRNAIINLFPTTEIIDGNRFGSVGLGLALDAKRKLS